MVDHFESIAGTNAAIITIWAFALTILIIWLIIEFYSIAFSKLVPWMPILLKGFRIGFFLSLLLPPIMAVIGSFAGPWAVLVVFLGMSYLPPSVYILCTALGGLYSVSRAAGTLTISERKLAYASLGVLSIVGCLMMYVSFVWLDKPV